MDKDTNHLDSLMRFALLSLNVMEVGDDSGAFFELLCCDEWALRGCLV